MILHTTREVFFGFLLLFLLFSFTPTAAVRLKDQSDEDVSSVPGPVVDVGGDGGEKEALSSAKVNGPVGVPQSGTVLNDLGDQIQNTVQSAHGEAVGDKALDAVKSTVGDDVKSTVGDAIKSTVGDAVKSTVGDDVKSTVGDAVKSTVGDAVKSTVGDDVKSTVGDAIKSTVGDDVKSTLGDSIKSAVADEAIGGDGVGSKVDSVKPIVELAKVESPPPLLPSAPQSIFPSPPQSITSQLPSGIASQPPPAIASIAPIAGVGSLPPLIPGSQGPISIVPLNLLPSNVNVVTHEANYGEQNPKLRPKCSRIVEEVERSTVKNRNSPAFGAFETIIGILAKQHLHPLWAPPHNTPLGQPGQADQQGQQQQPHLGGGSGQPEGNPLPPMDSRDDDKVIDYGIDVIKGSASGPHSLDWNYIASLRNCAVDDHGRTIFMKLIEEGHLKALANPGSRRLNGVNVVKLRDTMNNNLVHLAVMSKNVHVAEVALELVGMDHHLSILSQQNIDGERPVDLAIKYQLEDMATMLKGRYSTALYGSRMMIRRRHQAPDVLRAGDLTARGL